MALIITKLRSGKIEVSGGTNPFLIEGTATMGRTDDGVSLSDRKGTTNLIATNVTSVREITGYLHTITSVSSLYNAMKAIIDDAGGGGGKLPLTAFGDVRTAEMSPVFQGTFEYTVDNTEVTTNTVEEGGTITQASAMAVLGTSTTTASTARLVTKQRAEYRAGQGGLNRFTALFTTGTADTEQLIGLTCDVGVAESFAEGYVVGYIGADFGFHRYVGDSKVSVNQEDWDDPMDGTGGSGMTLDQTKLNVYAIQFQYLGAGAIRLLIEDDSTGVFVVAHTVLYANNFTIPSVTNPNFKFAMWVNNGGTTSDVVLKSASYGYFIEGKTTFIEIHQPQFSSGMKSKGSVQSEVAIFTIRNKAIYNSKTNFIDICLEIFTASIEAAAANNLGDVRLVKNTTLGGVPSWDDISATDSIVEIDTAGTTVTGGKELVPIPLAGKNDKQILPVLDYKFILSPGDKVTVAGSSVASATIKGALLWKELF